MDLVLAPADVMLSVKMLDLYSVSSKNGLNVRDKPSTSGNGIGVLNFNSLVNIVSKTGIELTIDDNDSDIDIAKKRTGRWVKIESLYQGKNTSANIISGYVFDGYLSKLSTRITQERYFGYPSNRKAYEGTYEDGKLISEKCWDYDGNEKECN